MTTRAARQTPIGGGQALSARTVRRQVMAHLVSMDGPRIAQKTSQYVDWAVPPEREEERDQLRTQTVLGQEGDDRCHGLVVLADCSR